MAFLSKTGASYCSELVAAIEPRKRELNPDEAQSVLKSLTAATQLTPPVL